MEFSYNGSPIHPLTINKFWYGPFDFEEAAVYDLDLSLEAHTTNVERLNLNGKYWYRSYINETSFVDYYLVGKWRSPFMRIPNYEAFVIVSRLIIGVFRIAKIMFFHIEGNTLTGVNEDDVLNIRDYPVRLDRYYVYYDDTQHRMSSMLHFQIHE